jgi:hypothetical protein
VALPLIIQVFDDNLVFNTAHWRNKTRIPCTGEIRPTVIDKIQPIESIGSIGSRLRENLRGVEAVDFNIQLLYTLNLWN